MKITPEIKKLSKQDKKLHQELDQAIRHYEKAKSIAKCGICPKYIQETRNYNGKLHQNCDGCVHQKEVLDAYHQFVSAGDKLDTFEETEYAKTVYETLKSEAPVVIENRTKRESSWEEAFGENYESNIPGRKYRSLIGLFEKDVGKYKLK